MFRTTKIPKPETIQGYPIVRTRRRTLAIQVDHSGTVTVRSPLHTSTRTIEHFLAKQKNWIEKHTKQTKKLPPKKYTEGEKFYYLGKLYPLAYTTSLHPPLELKENQLTLSRLYRTKAKTTLTNWYKSEAKKYLTARTLELAQKTSLQPKQIRISTARRRWGSCSARGTVSLAWRLILTPPQIIDYVILHELAHLKHLNHSPKFWQTVELLYPKHKEAKHWLKQNHHLLEP